MALPVVNVSVIVLDPSNAAPVVGASVTARLTAVDKYQGQLAPRDVVSGVTDGAGSCVLTLFPNALGEITGDFCGDGSARHTAYQFKVRSPSSGRVIYQTVATVPNVNVNLLDIAGNVCQQPQAPLTGATYGDGETPAGAQNGVNRVYTLAKPPSPPASLMLHFNGQLLAKDLDYTLVANQVTFTNWAPVAQDVIRAWYRYI